MILVFRLYRNVYITPMRIYMCMARYPCVYKCVCVYTYNLCKKVCEYIRTIVDTHMFDALYVHSHTCIHRDAVSWAKHVAGCCRVLQGVAVCCSVLHCVAVLQCTHVCRNTCMYTCIYTHAYTHVHTYMPVRMQMEEDV